MGLKGFWRRAWKLEKNLTPTPLKEGEGSKWHCAFTSLSMHELAKWQSFGTSSRDVPSLFTCVLSSINEVDTQIYRRDFRHPRITMSKRARAFAYNKRAI